MPVLRFENTEIPYEIRRRRRSKRIRITVRPGRVLVSAPRFTLRSTVVAFVESKRTWIYQKSHALQDRGQALVPERFVSGSKVMFHGRLFRLWVTQSKSPRGKVRFANAFHVEVEDVLAPDQIEHQARTLVLGWLEERALEDSRVWVQAYAARLGRHPKRIRIGNQKTLWGSCSARGVIALNWRLVALPKALFEYVVVHELCHLVERNHGERFWKLVASLLPDYPERRASLKQHGLSIR